MSGAGGLDAHLVVRSGGFELDAAVVAPAGATTALLGPNGAGKSTALAAIAGLVPLDDGHVTLDGAVLDDPRRGVSLPAEERRIGVVLQDQKLFEHLDVLGNVAFGPRSQGASRAEADEAARGWLTTLDLLEHAARRPSELSGGEAQRVALARTLAAAPRALLLDEPLSALDVSTRGAVRRSLATHLERFAGPRILVTHDPVEAFLLAELVHVIEAGRITQSGTPDELRLAPRTPYVADLAGTNLIRGTADGPRVDTGGIVLHVAGIEQRGEVLLTVHPRAITIHRDEPGGSPRNRWRTSVELVERLGDRVRVRTTAPLPLMVEVTTAAAGELELAPGADVWLALKATEITVVPG